jgi:hypothetical protein
MTSTAYATYSIMSEFWSTCHNDIMILDKLETVIVDDIVTK